jgi:hypothetical protein
MHCFSNLFDKVLYMFRTSTVRHQEYLNTVFVILVPLGSASMVRTKLADDNRTRITNTYCVYTVLRYSWWRTVDMSKTCRVLFLINLRNSASRWLSLQEFRNVSLMQNEVLELLPKWNPCLKYSLEYWFIDCTKPISPFLPSQQAEVIQHEEVVSMLQYSHQSRPLYITHICITWSKILHWLIYASTEQPIINLLNACYYAMV